MKKTTEHESDGYTNCNLGVLDTVTKELVKGLEKLEIRAQVKTI